MEPVQLLENLYRHYFAGSSIVLPVPDCFKRYMTVVFGCVVNVRPDLNLSITVFTRQALRMLYGYSRRPETFARAWLAIDVC